VASTFRVGVPLAAATLALLVAGAPAAAAPKRITGKLSEPGYTVIALAANGKATSVRVKRRRFRLRPPARSVTLQLRARNGRYAGPVVVGREQKGKRVIVGVGAGVRLGRVRVRRGHATVAKRLDRGAIDGRRRARARKGVPIGNGRNLGRVRSRGRGGRRLGLDLDVDGVPNVLDIDDDGDRIIDNVDRSGSARASQSGGEAFTTHFTLGQPADLNFTVNANAGSSDEQITQALPSFARIDLTILPGDSPELDCGAPQSRADPRLGGLVYCTRGGTGEGAAPPPPGSAFGGRTAFPGDPGGRFDPDGDGFGSLTNNAGDAVPNQALFPGATADQIGAGDLLIQRVVRGGVEVQFLTALPYVFGTNPALASFDDGRGNSTSVDYPVAGSDPGPPDPGTRENGFPVKAGPGGDVVLTLTFWRPQRRPIPPETAPWIDIGGLDYSPGIADMGIRCPQSSLSETDPNLTAPPPGTLQGGGFTDLAADRPASATNTLTYTLNLTRCLASHGFSFEPGETRGFKFSAFSHDDAGSSGEAEQQVFFKRQ